MRRRPTLLLLTLAFIAPACGSGTDEVKPADCPVLAAPGRLPETLEAVKELRAQGRSWTNRDIRARYVCAAAGIGALNEQWKAQGVPLEERARRAFQTRHDARMTARAMMSDQAAVRALEERDRAKYGDPGGPTFDWLVTRAKEKGLQGDAVYEDIIASAQRTDAAVNTAMGL